jgi:hypothetical protein
LRLDPLALRLWILAEIASNCMALSCRKVFIYAFTLLVNIFAKVYFGNDHAVLQCCTTLAFDVVLKVGISEGVRLILVGRNGDG